MITLVSPWYGPDTRGGAENQARSLANALAAQGHAVQIWASTGRDSFHPGADAHYPAGDSQCDGLPIWRFRPTPADERGVPRFFTQRPDLLPPLSQFTVHELRLLGSLLGSDELYARLAHEPPAGPLIFLPYPFPTSFWGALIAKQQSFLLPCLHDEPYARYATYRYLAQQVRGLLCNSHAEAALAHLLYALPAERICVAGEGIDLTPRGNGARFRAQFGLPARGEGPALLLYAGRRDESKNLPQLLAFLREYRARRGPVAQLLLIGQGRADLPLTLFDLPDAPPADLALDLGLLDEQQKHDAYAAADLFLQPSLHESFSIVLMEAWLQGAPALVHAECAVTADHVARSGGGLSYRDFGQFAAALDLLLARYDLASELGARGRAFVEQTCRWETVAATTAAFVLSEAQ